MAISKWAPIEQVTLISLGTQGYATLGIDLASRQLDQAFLQVRGVYGATAGTNHLTMTLWDSPDGGTVFNTVARGSMQATAVTSATVAISTLINGYPYVRVVLYNPDTVAALPVLVQLRGHYEGDWTTLI